MPQPDLISSLAQTFNLNEPVLREALEKLFEKFESIVVKLSAIAATAEAFPNPPDWGEAQPDGAQSAFPPENTPSVRSPGPLELLGNALPELMKKLDPVLGLIPQAAQALSENKAFTDAGDALAALKDNALEVFTPVADTIAEAHESLFAGLGAPPSASSYPPLSAAKDKGEGAGENSEHPDRPGVVEAALSVLFGDDRGSRANGALPGRAGAKSPSGGGPLRPGANLTTPLGGELQDATADLADSPLLRLLQNNKPFTWSAPDEPLFPPVSPLLALSPQQRHTPPPPLPAPGATNPTTNVNLGTSAGALNQHQLETTFNNLMRKECQKLVASANSGVMM